MKTYFVNDYGQECPGDMAREVASESLADYIASKSNLRSINPFLLKGNNSFKTGGKKFEWFATREEAVKSFNDLTESYFLEKMREEFEWEEKQEKEFIERIEKAKKMNWHFFKSWYNNCDCFAQIVALQKTIHTLEVESDNQKLQAYLAYQYARDIINKDIHDFLNETLFDTKENRRYYYMSLLGNIRVKYNEQFA